jgi:hypothetical protein
MAPEHVGLSSSRPIGFGDGLKGARGKQIITIKLADDFPARGPQTKVQSVVDSCSRRLDKANAGPAP